MACPSLPPLTLIRGRHYMRLTPSPRVPTVKDVCVVAEGPSDTHPALAVAPAGTGVPVCATAVVAFVVAFARDQ